MTYNDWFTFGGNEIGNSPRAFGIARTAACPLGWIKHQGCPTLREALGDDPYTHANISEAPWYDSSIEASTRFYGLYVLDFGGTRDSTRSAQVTQNSGDGGQIGIVRHGTRDVKVKAQLFARGQDALEYGRAWLSAALEQGACGQHGTQCGVTDLEYFSTCPPERGDDQSDEEYAAELDGLRRYLHDVAVTSGPFTLETNESRGFYADVVEWTFTSERPWVYHKTREVELPSIPSSVVTDIPINLVRYPSAEVSEGAVLLGTNLSTNPSVETNTTGWLVGSSVITGTDPAAYRTGVQSNDKAGAGAFSYRGRILGNGSTEVASSRSILFLGHDVNISSLVAGQRVSAHLWAAASINAGAAVSTIHEVLVRIEWRDGGGVLGLTDLGILDPGDFASGGDFQASSLAPPVGATIARLQVRADVTWRSSATPANNSDIRIYADKATISLP